MRIPYQIGHIKIQIKHWSEQGMGEWVESVDEGMQENEWEWKKT